MHLTEAEAARIMFGLSPDRYMDLPVHLIQPDYNLLRDVAYPIVSFSCTTEIPDLEGWIMHTSEGDDKDLLIAKLFDVVGKELAYECNTSALDGKNFMMQHKAYPCPLILRHNALVWCSKEEMYGVIQPLPLTHGDVQQYFDKETSGYRWRGYNVLYSDGRVLRVSSWLLGGKLKALSSTLYVKYSALLKMLHDNECSCPPLPSLRADENVDGVVVRAFLRYPESKPITEEEFSQVFVFLIRMMGKRKKIFGYELVGIPLTALVNLKKMREEDTLTKVLDFI
jgi:hypothetical protein